jgi:hypothetical protein
MNADNQEHNVNGKVLVGESAYWFHAYSLRATSYKRGGYH